MEKFLKVPGYAVAVSEIKSYKVLPGEANDDLPGLNIGPILPRVVINGGSASSFVLEGELGTLAIERLNEAGFYSKPEYYEEDKKLYEGYMSGLKSIMENVG